MQAQQIYQTVRETKIITIVRGTDQSSIIDIAKAVAEAGVRLLEVTCNTKGFAEMISKLSDQAPEQMIIGAGTVITKDLCQQAIDAGAKYIIAPDTNPDVIGYCIENHIAVIPGAVTPTEVLTAKRHGAKMIKIFPAAALGPDYIKMLKGPIDDIDFVAVGGVRPANVAEFMAAGCIAIGIGGSIFSDEVIKNKNWYKITAAIQEYQKIK